MGLLCVTLEHAPLQRVRGGLRAWNYLLMPNVEACDVVETPIGGVKRIQIHEGAVTRQPPQQALARLSYPTDMVRINHVYNYSDELHMSAAL
jgi:hypothetical protein